MPPSEEQPLSCGRAGRGQDRPCRRIGPAHCHGSVCPVRSRVAVCWHWIWPALWRAPNTAVTLRSGSKTCWKSWCGTATAILFVDEFHTIVGAGAAEGAIDAASILKPVLARGEIQIIGATTNRRVPHPHPEGCRTGTPFRQGAGRGAYACAGAGYPQRACAAL